MKCPNNHLKLEPILFHTVEAEYCPECLGMWFDQQELPWAEHHKDQNLNWLDFDIWRDKDRFSITSSNRRCPQCEISFVEVNYDDSNVRIDFCKHCQGIWLDRGEFKQIMVYLKKKADYEILHHYTKNLIKQLWEVFSGPKQFREELHDVLILTKLFRYKLLTQHPYISELITRAPK